MAKADPETAKAVTLSRADLADLVGRVRRQERQRVLGAIPPAVRAQMGAIEAQPILPEGAHKLDQALVTAVFSVLLKISPEDQNRS